MYRRYPSAAESLAAKEVSFCISAIAGNCLVYGHSTASHCKNRLSQLQHRVVRQTEDFRRQDPGFRNGAERGIHAAERQVLDRRDKSLVLRHLVEFP